MGGADPQANAAATFANQGTAAQNSFIATAYPAIQQVLSQYMSDLGTPGSEPTSVKNLFSSARNQLGSQFSQAELSNSNSIATTARSMGLDYNKQALQSAQSQAQQGLEAQRAQALNNLSFQEGQWGMNQTNALLSQMGQIERGLSGAGLGFGQAGVGELGLISNTDPWAGVAGGAISGAGTGAELGPWGAVAGGIVGGAAGYFGSGG